MLGEQRLASSYHLPLSLITAAKAYPLAIMDVGLATAYDVVYDNSGLLQLPSGRHRAAFRAHTAHVHRVLQKGGTVDEQGIHLPSADPTTLRRLALTEKWGDGLERWALRHGKNTHAQGGLRLEAQRITQVHHSIKRRKLSPLRHQNEVRAVIDELKAQRVA